MSCDCPICLEGVCVEVDGKCADPDNCKCQDENIAEEGKW